MAALKKGVAFSVGLVTANCSINGAVEAKTSNVTVCCGPDPANPHDPIRIQQVRKCSTCQAKDEAAGVTSGAGEVAYTQLKKAREVGDGLVLLEADELVEAKGDADAYKTRAALTPHPAAEVYSRTTSGEKAYYVTPDPGNEVPYALLVAMVSNHPELAFVCQWTARSNATQFRVTVRDGCLMMTELVREQSLKPVPQVTAEAPEAMLAMAEQVLSLPDVVQGYDPDTYADHYEERIQALLASKQVHAVAGTTATPSAPSLPAGQQAAMDALAAMLAAATPAPAKKAPTKKKVTA